MTNNLFTLFWFVLLVLTGVGSWMVGYGMRGLKHYQKPVGPPLIESSVQTPERFPKGIPFDCPDGWIDYKIEGWSGTRVVGHDPPAVLEWITFAVTDPSQPGTVKYRHRCRVRRA